jgi:hypothetical protein
VGGIKVKDAGSTITGGGGGGVGDLELKDDLESVAFMLFEAVVELVCMDEEKEV